MSYLCPFCDTWTILLEDGNGLCCGRNPKISPEQYRARKKAQDKVVGNPKTNGSDKIYLFLRRLEDR